MIIPAKVSRYILIVLVIFASAIVIPKYYRLSFFKAVQPPAVYYSTPQNSFIIRRIENKKLSFTDTHGNEVTRDEFENLTPALSFRQLVFKEQLPDSVNGVALEVNALKDNFFHFRIRPEDIYSYQVPLYPLYESEPGRPNLRDPEEFFRITDKIEFINCESNKVDHDLSESFNNALVKNGFVFPAKCIYGNPTTKKPFDDGYFITDNNGQFFHLKRIHDKPYCAKIALPEGLKIKYIAVDEMDLKEFHCLFITEDSRVFLVSFDNYKLIELPVGKYDHKKMTFEMMGTLLYREVSIYSEDNINTFITNRNYKVINTYSEKWTSMNNASAGVIFQYMFPFSLSMMDNNNSFVNFYTEYSSWHFLICNLICLIIMLFVYNKVYKIKASTQMIDLIIVMVTGVYGLIAVLLIRDEN